MNDRGKMKSEELLNEIISPDFPVILQSNSQEDLENRLAIYINELIDRDFQRLIQILYRIDISEEKLKKALQLEDKSDSSGKTIATLIIERQLQKLEFRKQFSKKKLDL